MVAREIKLLQALDHPAIIPLLDAFRTKSGRVYLVFPYLSHSALEALDDHPDGLPPQQLKLLTWQLLQALSYLHGREVIHRDIKPANVLLSEGGQARLCDFGASRGVSCGPRGAEALTPYVVTRWYRAPEVMVGCEYGPAADIWALSCTVAELASGEPLFAGTSTFDQLWRIMRCFGELPPALASHVAADPRPHHLSRMPLGGRSLRQRLPRCEPGLMRLLEACLKLDPARRGTAHELLQSPYFWSVPRLIAGTHLETVYRDSTAGKSSPAAAAAARAAAATATSSPQSLPPPHERALAAKEGQAEAAPARPSQRRLCEQLRQAFRGTVQGPLACAAWHGSDTRAGMPAEQGTEAPADTGKADGQVDSSAQAGGTAPGAHCGHPGRAASVPDSASSPVGSPAAAEVRPVSPYGTCAPPTDGIPSAGSSGPPAPVVDVPCRLNEVVTSLSSTSALRRNGVAAAAPPAVISPICLAFGSHGIGVGGALRPSPCAQPRPFSTALSVTNMQQRDTGGFAVRPLSVMSAVRARLIAGPPAPLPGGGQNAALPGSSAAEAVTPVSASRFQSALLGDECSSSHVLRGAPAPVERLPAATASITGTGRRPFARRESNASSVDPLYPGRAPTASVGDPLANDSARCSPHRGATIPVSAVGGGTSSLSHLTDAGWGQAPGLQRQAPPRSH